MNYVPTIHSSCKTAYLQRLRDAEHRVGIYEIDGKYIVAKTEHSAKMAFASSFDIRKLSHDELKELNSLLLFEAEHLIIKKDNESKTS